MGTLPASLCLASLSAGALAAIGAGIIALGVVGYLIWAYNRLVRLRQLADEAWSGIDVHLRQRHDLIPNLVEVVRGYATHEHQTLAEVTAARSAVPVDRSDEQRESAEGVLTGQLRGLFAVAEAYPQLRASPRFRDLHAQLVTIEDTIQKARRYHNGAVRQLNVMVESFPPNVIANLLGFEAREYFELDLATARGTPEVGL